MSTSLPKGLDFAYQNSPSTLGLYLAIDRTANYPTVDMTTVTEVIAVVTFPGGAQANWGFTPVVSMTTPQVLVASRPYAPGDTAVVGMMTLVATPFVGSTALAPAGPWKIPVKGPSLS